MPYPNEHSAPQASRFTTRYWAEASARKWLKDNQIKYISFEPAKEDKKKSDVVPVDTPVTGDSLFGLLAQLESELWVMEPKALQSFLTHFASMSPDRRAVQKSAEKKLYTIEGSTAHIPIVGILMKQIPSIFKLFGIEATSYLDIQDAVKGALASGQVERIQLDVDSPGGLVNGVAETADIIRAARSIKPVTAIVDEMSASGAYWLSSQATAIHAQRTSLIGSIGVFTVFVDSSEAAKERGLKVHVIRSGEHKGMGVPGAPITDEQLAAMQEMIDGTAAIFVKAVAEGRGKTLKEIQPLATGRLWLSAAAESHGLIDGIYNTTADIHQAMKGVVMNTQNEQEQIDSQAEVNRLTEQIQGEQRRLLSELRAYFKDDPDYAMAAFEKGQTLLEAKADYCDVLRSRLSAAEKDLAELKSAAEKETVQGVDAIDTETSDGVEGRDFLTEARELAKRDGTTVTVAMKKLARQEPELHAAFIRQRKVV